MKKKIFFSIVMLFAMFVVLARVNAAASARMLPVANSLKAVAPDVIPANGAKVKATVSDVFDFSKMQFKDASGNTIDGKNNLRKIVIGTQKSFTNATVDDQTSPEAYLSAYLSNWFTAYCLDSSVDYPYYGVFANSIFWESVDNDNWSDAVREIVRIAVMNQDQFKPMHDSAKTNYNEDVYFVETVYYTAADTEGNRDELKTSVAQSFVEGLLNGNSNTENSVTINIVGVRLADYSGHFYTYVSNDAAATDLGVSGYGYLTSNHENASVPVTVKLTDVAFHNYIANDGKTVNNHALWIVEHSYPTMNIADTLALAGVDATKLDTQIATLYAGEISGGASAEVIKENLVFGTVQYAVWYAIGSKVEDYTLGNTMVTKVGTEDFELNKLYNYLVQDRTEYNGYSNAGYYSDKITITAPSKELAETKDGYYYYGPFSASYTAVVDSGTKMQVVVTNSDKTGIDIVDSNYNVITELDKGQQYFVRVSTKANVGNVNYKITLNGIKTFIPASNRARVYYSEQGLSILQNAMSGGKATTANIQGEFSVVTNAKTGVENIALLLMVTLVAFTLGYVVLSYKSKPMQFNQ